MTEASLQTLENLRNLKTMQWYVIPILAIVIYIYVKEIKQAIQQSNWNAVLAGLTLFGMDFINETINGWIFHLSGYSALWTTPSKSGLTTMIGWNIEIMFMFAIAGIIYYHTLSDTKKLKILGLPETWFWAIGYSLFCVFVEVLLNLADMLIWEYPFWNRSLGGIWLIFFFGYFHFFVAIIFMLSRKTIQAKIWFIGILYTIAIVMNGIGLGILGWTY